MFNAKNSFVFTECSNQNEPLYNPSKDAELQTENGSEREGSGAMTLGIVCFVSAHKL